jgi:hypothetical protein
MSEGNGVYLGIFLGNRPYTTPKLTLGAESIGGLMKHLGDLNDPDPTEPEGTSPLNDLLDHVQTIEAAVALKTPITPPVAGSSPDGGFTPGGYNDPALAAPAPAAGPGKTCEHGAMKYKEGVSAKNNKPYKAYFCNAPYGAVKCAPAFIN